jgi:hypothetical protein
MTLHYKSKSLFEFPHCYAHKIEVLFSFPSPSLPDDKLLCCSGSSNFNTIGFQKSVSTTTNTATRLGNSITTNNEHILLVDDEDDIAKLFKKALERAGFIVDAYNDPLQSLSNYRAGMYDLLLLDIKDQEDCIDCSSDSRG